MPFPNQLEREKGSDLTHLRTKNPIEMKYKANVAKYERRDEEGNNVIICNINGVMLLVIFNNNVLKVTITLTPDLENQ